LPQFDQATFFNQIFWFFLGFFCFYFITVYFFLPFLCENLKYRKKKLENNFIFFKKTNFENYTQYSYVNNIFFVQGDLLNSIIINIFADCLNFVKPLKSQLGASCSFKDSQIISLIQFINYLKFSK
jgi:hypothetical protein